MEGYGGWKKSVGWGSIEVPVRILRPVKPVWVCVFPLGFYVVPPLGFCVAQSPFHGGITYPDELGWGFWHFQNAQNALRFCHENIRL